MSGITYRIAQRRVRVVEDLIEEWPLDTDGAARPVDSDELALETADVLKPLERVIDWLHDSQQAELKPGGNPARLLVAAHLAAALLSKTLDLFGKVRVLVVQASCQRAGTGNDSIVKLETARSALIRLQQAFLKEWPLPDEQTVQAARQDVKMGRHRVL